MSDKKETPVDWVLRHIIEDIDALSPQSIREQILEDIENHGLISCDYIRTRIVYWLDKWLEETHEEGIINYLDEIVDGIRRHYFPQTA
jgi:hypothetical protein